MKSNAALSQVLSDLQKHVERACAERPDADEAQILHNFLARYDLTPTEHFGIVDEYRRAQRRSASPLSPRVS